MAQQSLKLKWHWDKSDVLGPPAVAQLSDDNQDGNIDENDMPDLVFSGYGTLYAVSGDDGHELWNGGNALRHGSVAVGDIDGDGIVEMVVPLSDWTSFSKINGSGTTLEYPIVVDLDNDNHAEIVVTSSQYLNNGAKYRGVRVFENELDNWPATRRIWNQHSYHITNINTHRQASKSLFMPETRQTMVPNSAR